MPCVFVWSPLLFSRGLALFVFLAFQLQSHLLLYICRSSADESLAMTFDLDFKVLHLDSCLSQSKVAPIHTMIASSQKIYQFKITLQYITPPVWRCIQVPQDYSFWDLHVAIQDTMGWNDSHLHEWLVNDPKTGQKLHLGIYPSEFEDEPKVIMDWEVPIKKFFTKEEDSIPYDYDFGDNWNHTIELEKILSAETGKKYPICIDGKRACPPEDVGGSGGYEEFLDAISPAYAELL